MSPRDLVYVGHMLDVARKAVGKVQCLSRQDYDADENLRLALTHCRRSPVKGGNLEPSRRVTTPREVAGNAA